SRAPRRSERPRRPGEPRAHRQLVPSVGDVASDRGPALSAAFARAVVAEGRAAGRCVHEAHRPRRDRLPPDCVQRAPARTDRRAVRVDARRRRRGEARVGTGNARHGHASARRSPPVRKPRRRLPVPSRLVAPDRDVPVTVIEPARSWPRLDYRELWRYRELLGVFIWRDLKVRYKQTVLGVGWAIFQPLFTAVVYSLIFGRFAKFPSGALQYPIFAFAGFLALQYFSGALNISSGSLSANIPLL